MPSQKKGGKRARAIRYALLMVYCSLRQQVPMVFSLHLVYLSAVACISEEINLGPCWRKDILRIKGQYKSQNVTFFESAQSIRTH